MFKLGFRTFELLVVVRLQRHMCCVLFRNRCLRIKMPRITRNKSSRNIKPGAKSDDDNVSLVNLENQIKEEKETPKIDLSQFKFETKDRRKLAAVSPKKREHVKLEVEISPSKIKKEDTDIDSAFTTKDDNSDVFKEDTMALSKIKRDLTGTCFLSSSIKTENDDGKPLNWETILNNLREMRKNKDAPVDYMGSHKCPDEAAEPKVLTNI